MFSKYLGQYRRHPYSIPKSYPQDIQCIVDPVDRKGGVYIGNIEAAKNINTLRRFDIKAVLTAANGVFLSHPKDEIHSIKYIPAEDRQSFDISKYFDEAVEWISQNLKNTNILVHCMAGVSRSVSLFIAYLIKIKDMKYNQAFQMVKRRRRIINPNSGFIKQLKNYELKKRQKNENRIDRTPSPKMKYDPLNQEPFSTTPNQFKTNIQHRHITNDPYELSSLRFYSADKRPKSSYFSQINKLSEEDLDKKIQEIKKKYSSKSSYQNSRPQTRQHVPLRQTNSTIDTQYLRDSPFNRYYNDRYNKFETKFSDLIRNPQYLDIRRSNRIYSNYLGGSKYRLTDYS